MLSWQVYHNQDHPGVEGPPGPKKGPGPGGSGVEGRTMRHNDGSLDRVTIWHKTEHRKLSGNSAPFRRNLDVTDSPDFDLPRHKASRTSAPSLAGLSCEAS